MIIDHRPSRDPTIRCWPLASGRCAARSGNRFIAVAAARGTAARQERQAVAPANRRSHCRRRPRLEAGDRARNYRASPSDRHQPQVVSRRWRLRALAVACRCMSCLGGRATNSPHARHNCRAVTRIRKAIPMQRVRPRAALNVLPTTVAVACCPAAPRLWRGQMRCRVRRSVQGRWTPKRSTAPAGRRRRREARRKVTTDGNGGQIDKTRCSSVSDIEPTQGNFAFPETFNDRPFKPVKASSWDSDALTACSRRGDVRSRGTPPLRL